MTVKVMGVRIGEEGVGLAAGTAWLDGERIRFSDQETVLERIPVTESLAGSCELAFRAARRFSARKSPELVALFSPEVDAALDREGRLIPRRGHPEWIEGAVLAGINNGLGALDDPKARPLMMVRTTEMEMRREITAPNFSGSGRSKFYNDRPGRIPDTSDPEDEAAAAAWWLAVIHFRNPRPAGDLTS